MALTDFIDFSELGRRFPEDRPAAQRERGRLAESEWRCLPRGGASEPGHCRRGENRSLCGSFQPPAEAAGRIREWDAGLLRFW